MPSGAERWFHTLVVVGASLAGCGGKTSEPAPTSTGTGGATAAQGGSGTSGAPAGAAGVGAAPSPAMCAFPGQFVCGDYPTRTACYCDDAAPKDASECETPFDYTCTELACVTPSGSVCFRPDYVACHCDTSAPVPDDCATPEQFFCDGASQLPFTGCACRPEASPDPDSCPGSYCCQSNSPRFGCDCRCALIK